MIIYRIDENSRTGITALNVAKDYQLQAGDYTSFPAGAYTPITVGANGQLVGATLEEHEAWIKKWNAAHPQDVPPQPQVVPNQQENATAMIMKQLMTIQANQQKQQNQQNQINAILMKQIMNLQKTTK